MKHIVSIYKKASAKNRCLWEIVFIIDIMYFISHAIRRISYCEAIFHARSAFHKSVRIYFVEKSTS